MGSLGQQQAKPATEADSFRSSLEDVVAIAEKLAPHVGSVQDLADVCKLALKNDGQLAILYSMVTKG